MKRLQQNLKTGETTVVEVPIPTPQPGTALVRTAASLVSAGTERMLVEFSEKSLLGKARARPDLLRQVLDKARREGLLTALEAAFNRLDQPMALGYSSAGTIVALGDGLQGFSVGERVACAGGGYAVHAEYAVIPRNLMAVLPAEVDFEQAAFATLGAIALHGLRLSGAQVGERLAVIGLGLVGLLAVGVASAAGCQVLGIDLDARRVALAKQMGATAAILRSEAEQTALSFSRGRGMDAVLICADTPSADPVNLAGAIARDRASIVAVGAVGLELPRKVYYEKELSFINSRSYGPGRYDTQYEQGGHDYPPGYVRWTEGRNLEAVIDLLASRRLNVQPLISHHFPIEQASQAYELITAKRKEPFLGVLLTYPQVEGILEPASQVVSAVSGLPVSVSARPAGSTRVTLGVLGAGNFANAVLLPAVRKLPYVKLRGIASGSGLSANHAARKFGFDYVAESAEQLLSDAEINTIAILTRHHLHAKQVLMTLAAGKHVFCEKPLAITPQELDEIMQARDWELESGETSQQPGKATSPLLMIGFNRRFAPLSCQLHAFLQSRQEPLAAHYRVNAGYIPPTHWVHDPLQGGGRLIGEGCHFIDFLAFLVGEPPVAVTAQALPDEGRYRQDNFVLSFEFSDGSLGMLTYLANGDKAFPKERVEVFSGGRVAVLDDFRSLELVRDGRRKLVRSLLRQDKGHRAAWEAFATAIVHNGPPPIPYRHIFGVTRANFASLESLQRGERVKV
jgi:predicted dehydrogenase/threonine dehydrogenase-like Zn-dependent dehydrogenase